jgi:hypothetical protein
MSEPINIDRGRPGQSRFFCVPWNKKITWEMGEECICTNPRTNEKTKAYYRGKFDELWTDYPDSFSETYFDLPMIKLKKYLETNYPEFSERERAKFLYMEAII